MVAPIDLKTDFGHLAEANLSLAIVVVLSLSHPKPTQLLDIVEISNEKIMNISFKISNVGKKPTRVRTSASTQPAETEPSDTAKDDTAISESEARAQELAYKASEAYLQAILAKDVESSFTQAQVLSPPDFS